MSKQTVSMLKEGSFQIASVQLSIDVDKFLAILKD